MVAEVMVVEGVAMVLMAINGFSGIVGFGGIGFTARSLNSK